MTFATSTLNQFDSQISVIQEQIAALQLQLSEIQSRRQSAQGLEQMGQSAIDQVLAMLGACDTAGFPVLKTAFTAAIQDALDSKVVGHLPSNTWDTDTFETEPEPVSPAPADSAIDVKSVEADSTPVEDSPSTIDVTPSPLESDTPQPLAVPDKEPTIAEIKQQFIRQFNFASAMTERQVTTKFVKEYLQNRTDKFMEAVQLECTGKQFWQAANRLMIQIASRNRSQA